MKIQKLGVLVLAIVLLLLISNSDSKAQVITDFLTASEPIEKLAMDIGSEVYAITSKTKVYIWANKQWKSFANAAYTSNNIEYKVTFGNNIKAVAVNTDGITIITTIDDHILYYQEHVFLGGLPIACNGLNKGIDAEVYGIIKFTGYTIPVKFGNKFNKFDFLVQVTLDEKLKTAMNELNPTEFTYTDLYGVFIGDSGTSISVAYGGGYKLKTHKPPASFIPCEPMFSLTHFDDGTSVQIGGICNDGNLKIVKKSMTNGTAAQSELKAADWTNVDITGITGHKAKHLVAYGRTYPFWSKPQHFFGYTDGFQNGLFVYNPTKKVVCTVDLPGSDQIRGIHMKGSEMYVATGSKVYRIDIEKWLCETGLTENEDLVQANSIQISPNPTQTDQIQLTFEQLTTGQIAIVGLNGEIVKLHNAVSIGSMEVDISSLQKGLYFVRLTKEDGKSSYEKFVKL